MCGITGYIGHQDAAPILLAGLRRLEYRGYDSAGIAVMDGAGAVSVRRAEGKLDNLAECVAITPPLGHAGMGHTRWATHGIPCERNAHPHSSPDGQIFVVQNGIVENFHALRDELSAEGYAFASDTDTEVIAHLVHRYYNNGCGDDLAWAVRSALTRLEGPSAIVAMSCDCPNLLVAARLGSAGGIVVGVRAGEAFLASDVPAIVDHVDEVVHLDSGHIVVVEPGGAELSTLQGDPLPSHPVQISWDAEQAEKGGHTFFMEKEIYEQGRSLTDTLRGRLNVANSRVTLESLNLPTERLQRIKRVTILACGTSYYASIVGKHYIERLARIPVEIDYASEYRYRQPIITDGELVVAITQSGETADTLAAVELAKEAGAFTVAIVNVEGSQITRLCDGAISMQAGPEIGVASTKAFTAALTDLLMLAIYLGQETGRLDTDQRHELIEALLALPGAAGNLLQEAQETRRYAKLAELFHSSNNFLYIGRGMSYAIAREGALKLKEITYIHAEGYPAGEMKHGPIALIDEDWPTVVVAPRDGVYDKMVSQVEQIKARSGKVLAVANAGDDYLAQKADHLLPIPEAHEFIMPILAVLPLQLFAYEIALRKELDVDQPRNLAKSVTVE
jgi:glucosamine--fructose-6-phosphate aminotransferase (isomerizing)